jgi:hypothetical protein
MKTSRMFPFLVFFCVPSLVMAQASTTKQRVQSPAELGPEPKIIVTDAKATTAGISVGIQAQNLGTMGFWFERKDKSSGEWIQIIDSLQIKVPGDLRDSAQLVSASVVAPVLLPDKSTDYRVGVFGKAKADDPRDWTYSNLLLFQGFDNVPKSIANSIELQFSDQSLKISTETDEKVVLKASWHVGGHTGFGFQVTSEMENPYVELNYAAIPKESSGQFPAIDIALSDQSGHTLQEAKIAVKVVATQTQPSAQTVATKVANVKNQPVDSNQAKNTKFSWSELARTGLGALMKFFAI